MQISKSLNRNTSEDFEDSYLFIKISQKLVRNRCCLSISMTIKHFGDSECSSLISYQEILLSNDEKNATAGE